MNIKKMILAAMVATCTMPVFAQESIEQPIYEFQPYGFMQLQGGAQYTLGETKFKDLLSPTVSGSLGYKFSPVFGMRLNGSAWQSKGATVTPKTQVYKFRYIAANVDFMFDLSNMFCGFNPKRVFNTYAFVGGGANYAFHNGEANNLATSGSLLEYNWTGKKLRGQGHGGLGINLRLSDYVAFNIEANASILSDHYNSKRAGNADWYFNGLAGLTIKFGKGYKRVDVTPVVEEVPYVEPAPAPVVKEEPKPVVKEEPKPVKVEALKRDIYFVINKTDIRDNEEGKINDLVQYLNKYPNAKVKIVGYADRTTGNPSINMTLSQGRAAVVAAALRKAGVSSNRISTDYKGDTVQPYSSPEQNRVSVCVAE